MSYRAASRSPVPRHSPVSRRSLLATGALTVGTLAAALVATVNPAPAAGPAAAHAGAGRHSRTPTRALNRLLAGNRRFSTGNARHPRQSVGHLRRLAAGQNPFAITLACADSRVAPEILFDQGLGDVFDNRIAGNVVDDLLLGSVELAVEEFSPSVIMVLGHERCGAVTATIDAIRHGQHPPGHIRDIVEALRPIVAPVLDRPGDAVDNAVRANIIAQVRALRRRSGLIRDAADAGRIQLTGARYDLDTGRVTLVA